MDSKSDRLEKIITHFGEDDIKQMITFINRMIEIINKLNNEPEQDE